MKDKGIYSPFQHKHRSHPLFALCWSTLLGASQGPARLSSEHVQELPGSLLGSFASFLGTTIIPKIRIKQGKNNSTDKTTETQITKIQLSSVNTHHVSVIKAVTREFSTEP